MLPDVLRQLRFLESYGHALVVLLVYGILSASWVYVGKASLQPGWSRFLAFLPVVACNTATPLLFSPTRDLCTSVFTGFAFFWLTNAKVIGLALNRGPLCKDLGFGQFLVVTLAPITPQEDFEAQSPKKGSAMKRSGSRGKLDKSGGNGWQLAGRCLLKTAALGAIVYSLHLFEGRKQIMQLLYALGLYAFLGFFMDGPASFASSLIGLRISPHFDAPFLSHSVAAFWGKRWNLTAGNTLRFLVYDPIYEGRLVARAGESPALSEGRRVWGLMAAFVASGLLHEVIYWYGQRFMTGMWLAFFSMQGPVIVLETAIRAQCKKQGVPLPHWLTVAPTLAALLAMGDLFFFPPVYQNNLAGRVVDAVKGTFEGFLG